MPLATDPTRVHQQMPSTFLEATVLDPELDAHGWLRVAIASKPGAAQSVPWMPRADVEPLAGDAALVAESDEGNYWCVQWWPQSGQTPFDIPAAWALKEDKANKGAANGYAPLDSGILIPRQYLPAMAGVSSLPLKAVGNSGSKRAGRKLTVADFTTLLGVAAPIALYNFDGNPNDSSGNGRNLSATTTAPTYTNGITGAASESARFAASNVQAFFLADANGGPFNMRTGTFGCWFKTGKRGVSQRIMCKGTNVNGSRSWLMSTDPTDALKIIASTDGSNQTIVLGQTNVHDNRWHFGVMTFDGTTLKLYADAQLDGQGRMSGDLAQNATPFNIGNAGISDAAGTGSENLPLFGQVDEAFVHPEVLNEDQIRLLMCASVAHGLSAEPSMVGVKVRRRRRGGPFAQSDFPTAPRRLYNFTNTSLADGGTDNAGNLTAAGTVTSVDGFDGALRDAKSFPGTTGNALSFATPAFLAGTLAKSIGCWFQTLGVGGPQMTLLSNGSGGTDWRPLYIQASGVPAFWDGTALGADGGIAGNPISVVDGLPHFWCATIDPADAQGLRRKIYLDGRCVGADTSLVSVTAGTFWLGQLSTPAEPYKGLLDGVFFLDYALTPEAVGALWAVGSKALGGAQFDASIVEAADATNLYLLADRLDPQHLLDIKVAA